MPRINEATDTDLKVIERLMQIGWPKARIEKRGDNKMEIIIQQEVIERKIYIIRGHKVMLSTDLAELYEVEPRVLVQAVKRNMDRFPADFMFQLNDMEFDNLKSQIVTSSWGGMRRATPLMSPPEPKKRKIGFRREKEEG